MLNKVSAQRFKHDQSTYYNYSAVRTGSSNTHFFPWFCFFGGRLPQASGFRSAKQILVESFATQARAFILSDRNMFYTRGGGGRTTAGSNAPGDFLVFIIFFGGHLPQTSGFRSAKQILVVSSATQVRARILSDRNIFCTLGEGQQRRDLMPLGLFLFFFVVTCPRPPLGQNDTCR